MIRNAGNIVRGVGRRFERWREYRNSRKKAHILRESVINRKEKSVVDCKLLKKIKKYSEARFGSGQFWPWLALYTEVRGEFIEGWTPDDYYSFVLLPKINPRNIAYLSTFKTFDHRLFPGFSIKPLAVIIAGEFYNSEQEKLDERTFFQELKRYDSEVVIKKDHSPSGKEITFIQSSNIKSNFFQDGSNYLIQPSIKQHPILSSIHSNSVNTLRITTFLGRENKIKVLDQSLRVGASKKRIVNEIDLFVYLDTDGYVISNAIDLTGVDVGSIHPDSKVRYLDLKIPSLDEATKMCIKSHTQIPYLKLIGWDVCIDFKGTPRLIEWNAVRPDIWVDEALKGPFFSESLET